MIKHPPLSGFFREANGQFSAIRLALFLAVVAVLALIVFFFIHPDLLAQAWQALTSTGIFASVVAWIKGQQKGKEADAPEVAESAEESSPEAARIDAALNVPATFVAVTAGGALPSLPHEAVELILEAEGVDQPSEVPPESSGISAGRGYDLMAEKNFLADWRGVIPDAWLHRLAAAVGKPHAWAVAHAKDFRDIHITSSQADRVFFARTLPQEIASARKAFPGFDQAPPLLQGVLVSLGYNRGWGMTDRPGQKSRAGMRAIRDAVAAADYAAVPDLLRDMARLWPRTSGLYRRRRDEAALAERALATLSA